MRTEPGHPFVVGIDAVSTSERWGVNMHTVRCTSPVSVVSQCNAGIWPMIKKRRSALSYWPMAALEELYICLCTFMHTRYNSIVT